MRDRARLRFDGLFGALGERFVGSVADARRNAFPLAATMAGIAVCVSFSPVSTGRPTRCC
jgi:hypothetical protein